MNLIDLLSPAFALRGLAVLTAGCAVTLVMRRASAAARHHVLLCTMVAALIIPLAAAVIPQWRVVPHWQPFPEAPAANSTLPEPFAETEGGDPAVSQPIPTVRKNTGISAATPVPPAAAASTPSLSIRQRASIVWLTGASILLASTLAGLVSLHRLGRRATPLTSGPVFDMIHALRGELGLSRTIDVRISGRETMPMVWGVFRHCLLLPVSAVEWRRDRLRIVLLHELSHLRRRDPASLLFARFALAFHWFNPLAWIAHHQLRAEQETACDDRVLFHGITAPDYADEMLAFSAGITLPSSHVPAPMMLRGNGLERRLRSILSTQLNRRPLSAFGASNITLLAILLAAPFAIVGAADLVPKAAASRGRILDRNGIVLAETKEGDSRSHPFKALGVHFIGGINPSAGGGGAWGIEKSYDAELNDGKDIKLTLDARIQSVVEQTLRDAGIGRGAVVILDPANGDVIASASVPSFDPVGWSSMEEYQKLRKDPTNPIENRAVGDTVPGSTFHLVTALAASRKGLEDKPYECSPTTFGPHSVNCWLYNRDRTSHGAQRFPEAFASGCGAYFNKLSLDVGLEDLTTTADLLGLGRKTGIRLPYEGSGIYGVLGQREAAVRSMRWSNADTCFIGMGQGQALATPLQIARVTATVANGGRVVIPRVELSAPVEMTANLADHQIDEEAIRRLKTGMTALIATYPSVRSGKITIAGKTATAQAMLKGENSHIAWFTGYAPADKPLYAITVMVQHAGSGQKVAGPIARTILETVIAGPLPAPTVQEPNEGHLRRIEETEL